MKTQFTKKQINDFRYRIPYVYYLKAKTQNKIFPRLVNYYDDKNGPAQWLQELLDGDFEWNNNWYLELEVHCDFDDNKNTFITSERFYKPNSKKLKRFLQDWLDKYVRF